MATDTSKERRNSKKSRAADGFVMMAMAVVTLALCMGLVAQVGLSFWLAVTIAVDERANADNQISRVDAMAREQAIYARSPLQVDPRSPADESAVVGCLGSLKFALS